RPPELAEHVLDVAGSAHEQHQQRDEEDRRAEPEQEGLPPGDTGVERLRVDDDALLLQQVRELVLVGEGGALRLELRRLPLVVVRRRLLERALDRRALRGDAVDVLAVDLVEEEGAVGDADARRALRRAGAEVVVDEQQDDEEDAEPPPPAGPRARRGLGGWALRRARPARGCAHEATLPQAASRLRATLGPPHP